MVLGSSQAINLKTQTKHHLQQRLQTKYPTHIPKDKFATPRLCSIYIDFAATVNALEFGPPLFPVDEGSRRRNLTNWLWKLKLESDCKNAIEVRYSIFYKYLYPLNSVERHQPTTTKWPKPIRILQTIRLQGNHKTSKINKSVLATFPFTHAHSYDPYSGSVVKHDHGPNIYNK